ncbi:DUF4064 domain-containing protein [Marinilactibacillus kalidii]|uniref:DUF4064 domain-containing protein n=1 Tax=Marinilactibacillus kalidii TaxID=2820274 RepID=UPI001ABEBA6C|nr:DUF4064 domain-containing protein [Marinilactibacillus kalidii]
MMRRKVEAIIGLVGGVLALLLFGGFSATILSTDRATFETTLYPILPETGQFQNVEEAYERMAQFSTWMGIFLFLMTITLAIATVLIAKNKKPKLAGICYLVSGIFLLVGTQGLGFLFAFLLFVAAILSFFRQKPSINFVEMTQS